MKFLRFLVLSTTSALACVAVAGCGEGGGFRGASLRGGRGGTLGAASGAGAGGTSAGDAGDGGAGAGGQAGAAGADAGGADPGGAGSGGAGSVDGGSGGESGSGRAGGAGAAAGMSGAGGGAAGAMGGAGAPSAGTGGSGRGGISAGGAGNGGTGEAAGTSAGGSAGTAGRVTTCAERCNGDADCRVFSVDTGYRCDTSTHRCARFGDPCRSATECLPEASFWIFACGSDADCFFFSDESCVDVGGVGRCARLAPSADGCTGANPDEVTLPRFGASGSALVCGNASLTCSAGECVPACASNADCSPARNGSLCDTTTGLCRCVGDEDCGGAGVSRCNTATGRCECSSARDCDEVPNTNVCQAGRCGCSGVAACNGERTFSGTRYVCE